ncbi:hypothetical protein GCM10027037_28630 [Mucilaginibacter koreensis]
MDMQPANKADTTQPVKRTAADSAMHKRMIMQDKNTMPGAPMNHDHSQMQMQGHSMMSSQFSLDLPMSRDGSGSSWMPDTTPVYAYMIHGKKWMSMVHGNIVPRYTNQDLFNKTAGRGGNQVDAPNWLMFMTQRKVGKNGLFSVNTMFSFDPFLVGLGGYPLLYQTGESYKGQKLVDQQHPHDLFSQLTVNYAQRIAPQTDVYASFGYPGEPALGPPVFMHRLSAYNNPDAPLSHHYADATHITFGVATLGFRYRNFKLEGSAFKGREPDEERYGFDKIGFDSYSVRLSYNPSAEWALQASNGWIRSPEDLDTHDNVDRFTASAIHTKWLTTDSYIATTLVYGQNHHTEHGKTQPAVLLESNLQLPKTAVYGRYEFVQKDAEELDILNLYPVNPNLNINAFTLGANRILTTVKNTDLRLGIQATVNLSPVQIRNLYSTVPIGFEVYLRINPSLMKMSIRKQSHQHMPSMVM